jgi:multisubunit Na+/H+ antiporter MnhG subunit
VRHAIADVLLAVGVLLELGAVAGTVAMRDAYERVHYAGPASLGAIAIAAAVLVASGPSIISLQGILLAALIVTATPVLAHFTVRAVREWDRGTWRPSDDEIEGGGGR